MTCGCVCSSCRQEAHCHGMYCEERISAGDRRLMEAVLAYAESGVA